MSRLPQKTHELIGASAERARKRPPYLSWASLAATILGAAFGLAIIMWIPRITPADSLIVVIQFLLFFFVLTTLVVSLTAYQNARLRILASSRYEEKYARILTCIERLFAQRVRLTQYLLKYAVGQLDKETYDKHASEFIQFAVEMTKLMFDEFTKENCCVAVKALVPTPESNQSGIPHVKTLVRDRESAIERTMTDDALETYPYTDHSPFRELIVEERRRGFFFSNDLVRLEQEGRYRNTNIHWKRFYRAAAVYLIKDPASVGRENILGFLCVDNFYGGFDGRLCRSILGTVASTMYNVLFTSAFIETRLRPMSSQQSETKELM